jgi:hypothetical protein
MSKLFGDNSPKPKQKGSQLFKATPISKTELDYQSSQAQQGFKGGSKYDKYLTFDSDQDEVRATHQTVSDKFGNGMVKMLGTAGTSAAELFTSLPYGIAKAISSPNGKFSDVYDNEISQAYDEFNKKLSEEFPHYYGQSEKDAGLGAAIPGTAGSANFWFDKVANGLGFLGGSLISGSIAAKGFNSIGKLATASRLGKTFSIADKGQDILSGMNKAAKGIKFTDGASTMAASLAGAVGEAGMEARGIKNEVQEKLISERSQGLNQLSDEDIEQISGQAGNVGFAMNLAIVGGSNFVQFGKMFSGYNIEKKLLNKITQKDGVFNVANPTTKLGKTLDRAGKAAKALAIPFEEAAQEGSQFATEKGLVDYYSKKTDPEAEGTIHDMIDSTVYGLEQTLGTKDGLEAMLIGAIIGGTGVPGSVRDMAKSNANTKAAVEALNAHKSKPAFKSMYDAAIRHVALQRSKDMALATGDVFAYKNAEFDQFKNYVKSRLDADRYDTLQTELDDLKNLDKDELAKTFGIESGSMNIDSVPVFIDTLKKKAEELREINDDVNIRFGSLPEGIRTRIFDAASNLTDIDNRSEKLGENISKLTKGALDPRRKGELFPDYSKEYERVVKEISNPLVKAKLIEFDKDLKSLNQRREDFIKGYNSLVKPEVQAEILKKDEVQATATEARIENREQVEEKKQENTNATIAAQASDQKYDDIESLFMTMKTMTPQAREKFFKDYRKTILDTISKDPNIPIEEIEVNSRVIAAKEIPTAFRKYGPIDAPHTHLDVGKGVPFTPAGAAPTNVEKKDKPEVKTEVKPPVNAIKLKPTSPQVVGDALTTRNTEFDYNKGLYNLTQTIEIELAEGRTPIENKFDKDVFKTDFEMLADPNQLRNGTKATIEIVDTTKVEFTGKPYGKVSLIIKVDGKSIGKLATKHPNYQALVEQIQTSGPVAATIKGKWGSVPVRTTSINTSLNDIKTLSPSNLPDGKVLIGTIKGSEIVLPKETPAAIRDSINIANKVDGKHFAVLVTPEGTLYSEMLWNTPAGQIKIGDKTVADIIKARVEEFAAKNFDRPYTDKQAVVAAWNKYRAKYIDPITNYGNATSKDNLGVNFSTIGKTAGKYVFYLKKGKEEKTYNNYDEIAADIEDKFFNINWKYLSENNPFEFEGKKYDSYIDFLVEHNIVTTSLFAKRPFSFTQVTVEPDVKSDNKSSIIGGKLVLGTNTKITEAAGLPEVQSISATGLTPEQEEELKKLEEEFGKEDTLRARALYDDQYQFWDKRKELQWMANNLPQILVTVAEHTADIFQRYGLKAHGIFTGAMIHLAENSEVGTAYHEAFHAVFHLYLSDTERQNILKELKKDNPGLADIQLEEIAAEQFRDYVLSSQNVKPKGVLAQFFSDIMQWFKSMFGLTQLNDIYQRIGEGHYAKQSPKFSRSVSKFEVRTRLISKFGAVEQKRRVDTLTYQLFRGLEKKQNVNGILNIDFSSLTGRDLDTIFTDIKKLWSLNQLKKPSEARQDVIDKFDLYKTLAIKQLEKYGTKLKTEYEEFLDEEVVEQEAQANEVKERIYDKAAFETSQKESVAREVKLYLSTLAQLDPTRLAEGAETGKFVPKVDDLGYPIFVDFHDIYNYLSANLVGLDTIDDMLVKLEELAANKPEIWQVVHDLKKNPSQQEKSTVDASNFRHKFFTTFSNQYIEFLTLTKDSRVYEGVTGRRTAHYFNVYETNKRSLQRQIVNNWYQEYNSIKAKPDVAQFDQFKTLIDRNRVRLNDAENFEVLDQIAPMINSIGIGITERGLIAMKKAFFKKKGNDGNFAKYLSDTNQPSIGAILKAHHVSKLNIFSGVEGAAGKKELGERKAINDLAQFEKLVYVDKANASFLNGQNKTVFAINSNYYASKLVNRLKGNVDGILNKFLNIPYFSNSKLLRAIADSPEAANEFKLFTFDTVFDNDRSVDGTSYDGLDTLQSTAVKLNMFFNRKSKYGYFMVPTPSDRGNIQVMKLSKLTDKPEALFDNNKMLATNTEFYNWLVDSIEAEYLRIKQTADWDGIDPIKNYHTGPGGRRGNAYYFNQFYKLNDFFKLDEYYERGIKLPDFNPDSPEFQVFLSEMMYKQFVDEKKKLDQVGLVSYNEIKNVIANRGKETSRLLDDQLAVNNETIDDYIANYFYANTEMTKILSGDLAFYKGGPLTEASREEQLADLNKRFGQSFVPGRDLSVSTDKFGGGARPTFNLAIAEDNNLASAYITDYAKAVYDTLQGDKEAVDFATLFDTKKKNFNATEIYLRDLLANGINEGKPGGYLKNNQTDAQGYITMDRLRSILEGQGAFTGPMAAAWRRVNEGSTDAKDLQIVFQPIKGFYYNQEFKQGLAVPTQVKYSSVPLIPAFANKYPTLRRLLYKMTQSTVDEFVFESGIKAGLQRRNTLDVLEGGDDLQYITLDNKNWRIPQIVPYKTKSKENFGSQIRKLITSGVDNAANYTVSGKTYTGAEVKTLYQNLLRENIKEGSENTVPKFENIKKTAATIKEQIESSSRSLPDMYETALEYKQEINNTRIPLGFPLIKRKIENILNSIFDKGVIKQEIPGVSAVQVSSFGVATVSDDLKFIRQENGNVLPAEIIVSPQYFINAVKAKDIPISTILKPDGSIDMSKISEEMRKVVLYRIPTQGKNSMLPARIKGFLPAESGSTIVLPFEITTQAGSDFDIDKVYIESYNFKVEDGRLIKVGYDFEKSAAENSKEARQNTLVDVHYSILTDPKHFAEVITPNNTNTLKKLRDEIVPVFEDKVTKWWHSLWVQEDMRSRNQAGKQLVGVYSIQSTANSIAQDLNMSMKESVRFEGQELSRLDSNKNINGGKISDDLSERQSAAVDNAKEPILGDINDNKFTADVTGLLLRTGVGNPIATYFVNQPVVKYLTQEFLKTSATMGQRKALEESIKRAEKRYGIKIETDVDKITPTNFSLSYLKEHITQHSNNSKGAQHHKDVLEAFLKYKAMGTGLSMTSNAMVVDRQLGATIAENINKLNNLQKALAPTNKYVNVDLTAYKAHSLAYYEEFGFESALTTLKKYISLDASALMMGEDYSILTKLAAIKGDLLTPDEIQKVVYDFYTYLHTHPDSNYSAITNAVKRRILLGEGAKEGKSLGKRILEYAQANKTNLNPFISALKIELADVATGFDLVKYNNTASLTAEEKTMLADSLYDLYNSSDVVESKLARDLVVYSFITGGFSRGVDGFIDLIRPEFYEAQGIIDFFRTNEKFFESPFADGTDRFNIDNFIDQYVQNNYRDLQYVEKMTQEDFDAMIKSEDIKPNYIFTYGTKRLYKKQPGTESDYTQINKLGHPKMIKEYSLSNNNMTSILPDNNVPIKVKKQKVVKGDKVSVEVITNLLDKLSAKFGIKYNIINDTELDYAGKISDSGVTINLAYAGLDTPIHEFGHAFIDVVKKQNPLLYKNLVKQVTDSDAGKIALIMVEYKYPELSAEEQMEEAIVQLVGEYGANKIRLENNKGLLDAIKRFFERVAEYIKSIIVDKEFSVKDITEHTTLEELGSFIAIDDTKVNLETPEYAEQRDVVSTKFRELRAKFVKFGKVDPNAVIELKNNVAQLNKSVGYLALEVYRDPTESWRLRRNGDVKYQKINKLQETVDKVRDTLNRQIAIYSNKVDSGSSKLEELNNLKTKLDNLGEVEALNLFITEAKKYTESAGKKMNAIVADPTNPANRKKIAEIYDYIQGYDILDEIKSLEMFKLRNQSEKTGVMKDLEEAIQRRNEIKDDYFEYGIPLFVDWLMEYSSDNINTKAEELAKKGISAADALKVTREQMIKELREGSKDISKFSAWFDPAISSSDAALAMFAKGVKAAFEEARQKDIEAAYNFQEAYDTFVSESGLNPNNVEEFNSKLYETVKLIRRKMEGDEIVFYEVERVQFVQPTIRDIIKNKDGAWTYGAPKENPKYKELVDNKPAKAYYDFLVGEYMKAQSLLPPGQRKGFILPSVRKSAIDRTAEQGLLNTIKEESKSFVQFQDTDTQYGIQTQGGEKAKYLPIFYTNPLDAKDVSLDLVSSIMKFTSMANRFSSLNNIQVEVNLMRDIMGERKVADTNSKGEKVIDALSKSAGIDNFLKKEGNRSNSFERLDDFITMVYYGQAHKKEELWGFSADKLGDSLNTATSVLTLAGNVMAGVSNITLGNVITYAEAAGGQWYNRKNWANGQTYYFANLHNMLGDTGKIAASSLQGQLVDLYDPIQGDFKDKYGKTVSGGLAKKLFATDSLFMINNMGEHQLQLSTLFALLDATMVKNAKGEDIKLIDAYEKDAKGRLKLKEGIIFTKAQETALRNRLHGINKRLHGNYNDFDKAAVQKYTLGRMGLLFRKWIVPGLRRRFQDLHADYELDDIVEGNYRTFWRVVTQDIKALRVPLITNWNNLSDLEKQNIRRTLVEINAVVASGLIFALLGSGDDDEEKNSWGTNFIAYQARRLNAELLFFSPWFAPKDSWRVLKSPTATMNSIEKTASLIEQIMPWNITEEYDRKAGPNDKGDLKAWSRFKDIVPVVNKMESLLYPEEGIKFLNR